MGSFLGSEVCPLNWFSILYEYATRVEMKHAFFVMSLTVSPFPLLCSTSLSFYDYMQYWKEIAHRTPTPFLFFYSGAGWSRATLHRQVEVCASHHNLSLFVFIVFIASLFAGVGKQQKGKVGV